MTNIFSKIINKFFNPSSSKEMDSSANINKTDIGSTDLWDCFHMVWSSATLMKNDEYSTQEWKRLEYLLFRNKEPTLDDTAEMKELIQTLYNKGQNLFLPPIDIKNCEKYWDHIKSTVL